MCWIKNPKCIFVACVAILLIKSYLEIPQTLEEEIRGYTAGGYAVALLAPLIGYSLTLGALALLVALIRRNVRRDWFPTFAWLLLSACVADGIAAGYNKMFLEPAANKAVCQVVFNGRLPKPSPREKELDNLYFQLNCQDFLAGLKHDAEAGNPDAQYRLGNAYVQGIFMARDDKEAAKWYYKAAVQGNEVAKSMLDMLITNSSDPDIITLAAEVGIAEAQYDLGLMYEVGMWGVIKDEGVAYMWANIAAANGSDKAEELRNRLEHKMTQTQIAEGQRLARKWMQQRNKPK